MTHRSTTFDIRSAACFIRETESLIQAGRERKRAAVLQHTINVLKARFTGTQMQAWITGSLIREGTFGEGSDIDIVLKNYTGSRFDIWCDLADELGENLDVILYEKCGFREHLDEHSLKVV
ncbi:MAG: hypothetical protein PHQ23_04345 [Candidatus Wallbacteria bacterium]|nr:hypothetical protein [Candidatus Wallbacteria bacterium]